jgi:DNA repair exonuclease SbcCD ATPase subunit
MVERAAAIHDSYIV